MIRSSKAFLSVAVLVAGLAAAPINAQTANPAQPPTAGQFAAPTVQPTDAQLHKFIEASRKVAAVAQEYQPKVESSTDDAARQEVIREADEKMVQIVRADGLTVEEFNGIGAAVDQDPQVRQRALDVVNKTGG